MNFGTKVRATLTILAIIATITIMIVYFSVFTIVAGLLIIGTEVANHWYNNDYTEEHCLATGRARQMRKENTVNYIGERFSDGEDE